MLEAVRTLTKNPNQATLIPRHYHWDWTRKETELKMLAVKFYGVSCQGRLQGIMKVETVARSCRLPEPPLILDDVRALQKLDRQYYSSVDDGPLCEFVSRAYIGAKQVFLRPTLILEVVRKQSLKALYLPDRKRILIDSSEPKLKWRWNESHEIIHAGVPWHQDAMFGDTEHTLSPSCHEQIEAQANYGAGQLLFFQDQLRDFISLSTPNFALVQMIKKRYGNTLTSPHERNEPEFDLIAILCIAWQILRE